MNALPARAVRADASANDRLRRGFTTRIWSWLIVATGLHFAAFALWPELTASEFTGPSSRAPSMIELPPDIPLPAPPERRERPAAPVMADVDVGDDMTIAPTTFDANPPDLVAPPAPPAGSTTEAVRFTPFTVRPEILNLDEVRRELERLYPPALRDTGIGGTVDLAIFVDEVGQVQEARVSTSSGHRAFDDAALALADVLRFSPALNRDQRVAVWVSFPVVFETR